jgi:hypothetical protein
MTFISLISPVCLANRCSIISCRRCSISLSMTSQCNEQDPVKSRSFNSDTSCHVPERVAWITRRRLGLVRICSLRNYNHDKLHSLRTA